MDKNSAQWTKVLHYAQQPNVWAEELHGSKGPVLHEWGPDVDSKNLENTVSWSGGNMLL